MFYIERQYSYLKSKFVDFFSYVSIQQRFGSCDGMAPEGRQSFWTNDKSTDTYTLHPDTVFTRTFHDAKHCSNSFVAKMIYQFKPYLIQTVFAKQCVV